MNPGVGDDGRLNGIHGGPADRRAEHGLEQDLRICPRRTMRNQVMERSGCVYARGASEKGKTVQNGVGEAEIGPERDRKIAFTRVTSAAPWRFSVGAGT